MRAGLGYWARRNYSLGNAKVYDGTFDYDLFSFNQFERTQAFTMLFAIQVNENKQQVIAGTHKISGGSNKGWDVRVIQNAGLPFFAMQLINTSTSRLFLRANTAITIGAKNTLIITYNGNSLATGMLFYLNGVQAATTTINNNLAGTIIAANSDLNIGRLDPSLSPLYMNSLLKQFEIINRVATPAEIAQASATGSLRGANINHANGQYLLAVDFDKTGTVAPTTYAGTPTYTITSFGGASYTPYL